MIRLSDAFVLAYTKLRVHRIRTGIAVGVSGILFGLIAAVIIVAQGVFSSVDTFSDLGLNNRTILNVTRSGGAMAFNEYDQRADLGFVAEVEAAHGEYVAKKVAAAKKYGVSYTPSIEDPSPIMIDPETKQKVIKESAISDSVVQELAKAKRRAAYTPFDIQDYVKKYPSATVIQKYETVIPAEGALTYMKEGKEAYGTNTQVSRYPMDSNAPTLTVLDGSLSKPFISDTNFDPSLGEIPAIVPYSSAEKLLGLTKLKPEATTEQRLDRLAEVRDRINEVTVKYCYRNNASQALISRAVAQQEEMKLGALEQGYQKPALVYTVPDASSCGPVTISSDTRSSAQKKQEAQQILYEKEIGTYIGEPQEQLVTVRGVGISSEVNTSGQTSVADMTQLFFSSSLGYGTWSVPADLLEKVPKDAYPNNVFSSQEKAVDDLFYFYESYLVELTDKEEARAMTQASTFGGSSSGDVYASPFGSAVLIVDELKTIFTQVLLWVLLVVGGVAVIILASIIGRTVSEGRRESSIFRAIGASRLDIAAIYGNYVLLLALRVIMFTAVLGIGLALTAELFFWKEATLGARLAYASTDVTKEFHLFSLGSPYLLWIAGTIIVASILASIIPILLGARRNPIKDMRNDT